MESFDWTTFFIGLTAFGTILVAVVAIWGEWLRAKCVGPRLRLVPHNLRGDVTTVTVRDGQDVTRFRAIYYHLRVENHRSWVTARNCRVILRQIFRCGPDGTFQPVPLAVPLQYVWAPAEWSPVFQSITDQAVLDFGCITEHAKIFKPILYITSADFQGFITTNQAVRYGLQIVADNYVSPNLQIFEVAWNGNWTENLDEMQQNLTIREIPI